MTVGGRIDEGHLLLDPDLAGCGDDLTERPADVFPEVIWPVDSDEEYLPVVFSSGEEEVGEVQVGIVGGGDAVAPLPPDFGGEDEDMPLLFIDLDFEFDDNINRVMQLDDEDDEDADDENADDEDETCEDSGYGSMSEDEELIEDIDEEDPLVQQLPPGRFQQRWREEYPPVPSPPPVTGPHQLNVGRPQHLPQQQTRPPPEGLASEESAPSTSGLGSSAKRSREEDKTEQVSMNRQLWNCEQSHEDSAPSGSGLASSSNRSREESYRDSAPSTSGIGSSTNRIFWHPFPYERGSDDNDSD